MLKNGKLKRAIIVACIPFLFTGIYAFADMYFSVKQIEKQHNEYVTHEEMELFVLHEMLNFKKNNNTIIIP